MNFMDSKLLNDPFVLKSLYYTSNNIGPNDAARKPGAANIESFLSKSEHKAYTQKLKDSYKNRDWRYTHLGLADEEAKEPETDDDS